MYYVLKIYFFAWLKGPDMRSGLEYRQQGAWACVKYLGIKVDVQTPIPDETGIVISNHRSYLDPIIILHDVVASVVAKAEVSKWPVVGPAVKASYAILVDRKDKDSRRKTREAIKELLDNDFSVVIFPEGTTYRGPEIGEFRQGIFQTAEEGGFAILPVAIEYEDQEDAWVGDDTFVRHFYQSLGKKEVHLKLRYGSPIKGMDREELQREAHKWIQKNVQEMREEWDKQTA